MRDKGMAYPIQTFPPIKEMDMRDWFAGLALQAQVSCVSYTTCPAVEEDDSANCVQCGTVHEIRHSNGGGPADDPSVMAAMAYEYADAMLAARKEDPRG